MPPNLSTHMPVLSIWKIEHIGPDGRVTLLLNYGDDMDSEFDLPTEQQSTVYSAIGAAWGKSTSEGAVTSQTTWTRRTYHDSPQAARSYQQYHPAMMPYRKLGKIRFSLQGGAVWERLDSVVLSATSKIVPKVPHCTLTAYAARIGKLIPVSGVPLQTGFPWEWILPQWQTITTNWQDL